LRSNNGGVYRCPFEAHYKDHGIRHEKVPPKTPQVNGLAKRMNKTIAEKVRCMLLLNKWPNKS